MVAPPPRMKNRNTFSKRNDYCSCISKEIPNKLIIFCGRNPPPPLKSHIFQTVGIKQETLFAQLRYMILNNIPPDIKVNLKLLHFFVKPVLC